MIADAADRIEAERRVPDDIMARLPAEARHRAYEYDDETKTVVFRAADGHEARAHVADDGLAIAEQISEGSRATVHRGTLTVGGGNSSLSIPATFAGKQQGAMDAARLR